MEREKPLDAGTIIIDVPDDVKCILEERAIRLNDVIKVIIHAENTGDKIKNGQNGHYISRLVIGNITCWAEYSVEEDRFTLYNAYFHRIQIGGE